MRNLLDSSKKGFLTIKDTFLVFSWTILYLAVIPRAAPPTFPITEINMWKKLQDGNMCYIQKAHNLRISIKIKLKKKSSVQTELQMVKARQ